MLRVITPPSELLNLLHTVPVAMAYAPPSKFEEEQTVLRFGTSRAWG